MAKRDDIKEEVELSQIERLARIVGDASASAAALRYADANGGRKNAVFCRTYGGTLLVFPNLLTEARG